MRPFALQEQASDFTTINGALTPVVMKAFVMVGVHVSQEESRGTRCCPVVDGNCRLAASQHISV